MDFIPFLLVVKNPNLATFCAQFYISKLAPRSQPIRSNGRYIKTKVNTTRKIPSQGHNILYQFNQNSIPKFGTNLLTSEARSKSLPNLSRKPSIPYKRSSITSLLSKIPVLKDLSLKEGETYVFFRLKKLHFQKSPTQPETPPDGNCMVHAIQNQMRYDPVHTFTASTLDHHQLRVLIANSLLNLIDQGKINWNDEIRGGSPGNWIERMSRSGTHCDEVFLTAACLFLHRNIITYPVIAESDCDRIINPIGGIKTTYEPFHLLLYSETHFKDPHYQSIRPEKILTIPIASTSSSIIVVAPCK